jgi:hypothetical protein
MAKVINEPSVLPDNTVRVSLFMDGDMWCAVLTESFTNLQESPAGFGKTPSLALESLRVECDFVWGI